MEKKERGVEGVLHAGRRARVCACGWGSRGFALVFVAVDSRSSTTESLEQSELVNITR